MPPKPQKRGAFELFQSHFDPLLNPAHELVQLAQKIDWDRFEAAFAGGYSPDLGAPAKATRRMVGLQDLKYTFNESDESVVGRPVEDPYWQSFCGDTHLQDECPIHPRSLTKWRQRVGAERPQKLLKETLVPCHSLIFGLAKTASLRARLCSDSATRKIRFFREFRDRPQKNASLSPARKLACLGSPLGPNRQARIGVEESLVGGFSRGFRCVRGCKPPSCKALWSARYSN